MNLKRLVHIRLDYNETTFDSLLRSLGISLRILVLSIIVLTTLIGCPSVTSGTEPPVSDSSLPEDTFVGGIIISDVPPGKSEKIIWSACSVLQKTDIEATNSGTIIVKTASGSVALKLASIDRGLYNLQIYPGVAKIYGNHLNIERSGFSEWYSVDDDRIEQGLKITERLAGSGKIAVSFMLSGNLHPTLNEQIVVFTDERDIVMKYGGLAVYDAGGKPLEAQLKLSSDQISWYIDDREANYPITIDPYIITQQQYVTSPTPLPNARFGYSVSLYNDTMIVGEDGANFEGYQYAGQVNIYKKIGDTWVYANHINAPDPSQQARFGYAVSIENDTAVVGAYRANPSGITDAGQAYVFKNYDSTWNCIAILNASDKTVGAGFGSSVVIKNDTIIIGSPLASLSQKKMGQVYVFQHKEEGWKFVANISSPDEKDYTYFGSSVSLNKDTIVVGAYQAPSGNPLTAEGRVYVYKKLEGFWNKVADLSASTNKSAGAQYGTSVSIDDETIIVGAINTNLGLYSRAGQAYIYKYLGGTWRETATLIASDKNSNDYFGSAVSVDHETTVVGSYNAKKAYVFKNSGGTWLQIFMLNASDMLSSSGFGKSISFNAENIVIGAPWAAAGITTNAGKAYVFSLQDLFPPPLLTKVSPSSGDNTLVITKVNIIGMHFNSTSSGTIVKLTRDGYPDILATNVIITSATEIACDIPIKGIAAGKWNIEVINPDGQEGIGKDFFTIIERLPAPTVISIIPSTGVNSGLLNAMIIGTNFNMSVASSTTIILKKNHTPPIIIRGVTPLSSTRICVSLPITGLTPGIWDIVVINPDGQEGIYENQFTIKSPESTIDPTSSGELQDDNMDNDLKNAFGQVKTISKIRADSVGTFTFSQPCSATIPFAITEVQIVPMKDLGETTVTVVQSTSSFGEISGLPVAGYRKIDVVSVNPNNIKEGSIKFVINEIWIDSYAINPAKVVMMKYNKGKWEEIPTTYLNKHNDCYYYEAATPNFSIFAVTVQTIFPISYIGVTENPTIHAKPSVTIGVTPQNVAIQKTTAIKTTSENKNSQTDFPLLMIAFAILCVTGTVFIGLIIRRWWLCRQNPALFRKHN